MATTLIIMRHAKADEGDYAEDILRPLAEEGREQQIKMAEFLKEKGYHFSELFTSPFLRARQSAICLSDVHKAPNRVEWSLAEPFKVEDVLGRLPDPALERVVGLVGHDPGISGFVNQLCAQQVLNGGMAKGGAVIVTLDANELGKGSFVDYFKPEDL
jgi:phosphohistidine phosphatase SixA